MAEWFSSFASQAMQFADGLADSLVAQANAAQSELAAEQKKIKEETASSRLQAADDSLPWESDDETKAILSQDLMERILKLSLAEKNFTNTPPNIHSLDFSFPSFVPTAMKLLSLDANLARLHAKLSPKMNEEVFWQNYYFRIYYLRAVVGMDDATPFQLGVYPESEIIYQPSSLPDSPFINPEAPASVPPSTASAPETPPATRKQPSSSPTQPATEQQLQQEKLQEKQLERQRQEEEIRRQEAQLSAAVEAELMSEDFADRAAGGADADLDLDLDLDDLDLGPDGDLDLDDLGDLDLDLDLGEGTDADMCD